MSSIKLLHKITLDDNRKDINELLNDIATIKTAGADMLYIEECSNGDSNHDYNIGLMIDIKNNIDIQFCVSGNIKRLEDVKKYLYAGAEFVVFDGPSETSKEAVARFGEESVSYSADIKELDDTDIAKLNQNCKFLLATDANYIQLKNDLKSKGFKTTLFESDVDFDSLKLNSDGMIPVVVQDYRTMEVLMMAYMNKEAFEKTIQTGVMTYYSRSRDELWVKGLTSGHYQYLKELSLDCDNDTLLAKVYQVGAACHTGKKSCFFNQICKADYDDTNPMTVFEDVYNVIMDRKNNPKEGSYTNYLFDKGIDKILKKVGEEATEIVIAAKNPDPQEIKYEISDFLYHVMVLMAERGVTWEDITEELSRR